MHAFLAQNERFRKKVESALHYVGVTLNARVMRFSELYLILLAVYTNCNLPPTQRNPRNIILCKMSAEKIQHCRTRWTDQMCIDLLTCKDEAKQLHTSEECPTNEKGRKIGLMQLTLKFWNEKGYENLGKTAQNLRDK